MRPEPDAAPSRARRLVRAAVLGFVALLLAASGWYAVDVHTPQRIPWQPVRGSQGVLLAPDLVLQDRLGEDVYATRGFSIYRSRAGGPFEKIHEVRPPLGEVWAGYSRLVRDAMRQQELVEVVPLGPDLLLAFAGGEIHRIDLAAGSDEVVHELRYFGRGEGRGVMPHGIAVDDQGRIFYGEYPTLPPGPDHTVRLYRSDDQGRTWQVAYEFAPGETRHIHAVRWDPYARAIWIGTGDRDEHSHIGHSTDGGAHFAWVGSGSQRFRTVSFLFDPESARWAMDAPGVESHVLRWDRATGEITVSDTVLPGPAYYLQGTDGQRGLVTLAERVAAVWTLQDGVEPEELITWTVMPDPSRPHPVVRLPRSGPGSAQPADLLLNPLRTEADHAVIYRVPHGYGPVAVRQALAPGPRSGGR